MSFNVITSDIFAEEALICKSDYGFSIKCQPAELSALLSISNCIIETYGNFSAAINLSCYDLPQKVSCAFSSNPVFPIAGTLVSSKLLMKIDSSVYNGNYSFTIKAESGFLKYTIPMKLTIIH